MPRPLVFHHLGQFHDGVERLVHPGEVDQHDLRRGHGGENGEGAVEIHHMHLVAVWQIAGQRFVQQVGAGLVACEADEFIAFDGRACGCRGGAWADEAGAIGFRRRAAGGVKTYGEFERAVRHGGVLREENQRRTVSRPAHSTKKRLMTR
jgi:hypothetical protein